ncbi:MAG: hypothetical protein RL456_2145 [Pseudomonadota bacterium]
MTSMANANGGSDKDGRDVLPWWRHRMLWLVIGGPLVVVVASFVTLGLALRHPDPVIEPAATSATDASQVPAMQGRNHAATGGVKAEPAR